MEYEQTIMLGQYREELAHFALTQAEKKHKLDAEQKKSFGTNTQRFRDSIFFQKIYKYCGDMIFFFFLAITLATLSFVMDICIHFFYEMRDHLSKQATSMDFLKYMFWVLFTVIMVLISAFITRYISPQIAGSGVSEMKVILRGVVLKEYLSLKTLICKPIGLMFTLGSGLPLGREGPFVHIASMMANLFMKFFSKITNPKEYESRFYEVIAVACGVGVAVTFASPVGGVLYSIECVSVFFSVRSYWHGFFASAVGALFWRLLTVWFHYEDNITHIFKTHFRLDHPYETLELIAFLILGIICGFASYIFVQLHESFVMLNRRKNSVNTFFQKFPMIYPMLISLIVGLVSYPPAFGQFYASWLSSEEAMHELFVNFTWQSIENLVDHDEVIDNWRTPYTSIFFNTFMFFVMNMLVVTLTATIPMPSGLIVPSFKIGAGLGRFFGELMSYLFPNGKNNYFSEYPILPGAYAVAGSAAFAGANTGALSSAVIIFETTGQLTHLLPVIVAILAATITARYLGPSIYDNIIKLKKLPYLPSILPSDSSAHRIFVEDFMERDLKFVWEKCTYRYLRHLIMNSEKQIRAFPVIKSPENMILLGTVERSELQSLLNKHLNRSKMINDLKKSIQSFQSQSSINCPVHGAKSINIRTLSKEDSIEVSSIGTVVWEEEQLDLVADFTYCPIEPAPFQLMEGTSLMKVHNLFSLLGLQIAYVTSLGTLVGIVSLTELRKAIEAMHQGLLPEKYIEQNEMDEEIEIEDNDNNRRNA